jgi:hypothetical protein
MNQEEAKAILRAQMHALQTRSYVEFCSWIAEKRIETPCVKGASGTEYQLEIQAWWDNRPGGAIRVLVSIDDGSFRSSLLPLGDSFLISAGR